MRFHVPCLPHTRPTLDYVRCAYSQKIRNFVRMMSSLGHTVFVYESTAPLPPEDYLNAPFEPALPLWQEQNAQMIARIHERAEPRDFLCLIAGRCQEPIAHAFPQMQAVEYGVGYYGVFAPYCVFESYAHMANVYREREIFRGRMFDAVIPNYFDPAEFPFSEDKDDYLLFMARLNEDKGLRIAQEVAHMTKRPLVVAGQGTPPPGVDYRGVVGVAERGKLMSRAHAVLSPSLYLEPFGGVAVEAQLCGTPVITTDFGAYPETVIEGVTGFRCHTLPEFVAATEKASTLDPCLIRHHAKARFALDVVKHQYDAYFTRLHTLWDDTAWPRVTLAA